MALLVGGCHELPEGRDAVDAVAIDGVDGRLRSEIETGIATHPSPRFLGLFEPGVVFEYEIFEQKTLERDLARIERQLRRRGYYEARVSAARVVRKQAGRVRVEVEVDPGTIVRIRRVETKGLGGLPFDAAARALRANPLRAEEPFDEDVYEQAQVDVSNALADVGYAYVRTQGTAQVDLTDQTANVTLDVRPGLRAVIGAVEIEGLHTLPRGPIESTLMLKAGDRYSRRELELARAALFDLGVFSKVEVVPDTSNSKAEAVPILVRVEEAPQRSVTAGVGARMDVLRFALSARLGWTHRNFLGGLRKFSISSRPALTLFPTRIDNWVAPTRLLPENALLASLEQPGFVEGRTRGFVDVGYNIYPLLYPLPEEADPNQERIIGYNEITAALGVRRTFFGRMMPASLSMNWRSNFPFTYQGSLQSICGSDVDGDRCGLDDVIVTYPELLTDLDLRDDPISPTKGLYLSNSLQTALPLLGGQLLDVRIRPEARVFVPLDYARRVILAARVAFGFVFPQNYGDALIDGSADPTSPDFVRDQHRLLFRAFYSGGPQSNRGYPYQRIGPQGPIGFLVPTGVDCSGPVDGLANTCIRPLGGFSLWEASLELRFRTTGPWTFVAFLDASDVDPRILSVNFATPHISAGPGLRYASPVGPVRVDMGFRIPGLQKLTPTPENPPDISETEPYASERWWEAFALHILIGEAF